MIYLHDLCASLISNVLMGDIPVIDQRREAVGGAHFVSTLLRCPEQQR